MAHLPTSPGQAGTGYKQVLFLNEGMELLFEFIDVVFEGLQFFVYVMMRNAVPEGRVAFGFLEVTPDLVFEIVDVDELDVELVVEVFDIQQYIVIGFPGCEIVQFAFQLVDLFTVSDEFVDPFVAFLNKRALLCFCIHLARIYSVNE